MRVGIFIPARLASTRLPNKALVDIAGKPMISHVVQRAFESGFSDIFVATDDENIKIAAESEGCKAIMTDPNLPSGTDRIYEAMTKISEKFDIIVNLQGDMPNIKPYIISEIVNVLKENSDADISTAVAKIVETSHIVNPNVVKVALSCNDDKHPKALYFSRESIPSHSLNNVNSEHFHHLGIYGYRAESIAKFVSCKPSYLEQREKLEQLRALENDMKIRVCIVKDVPISIDTAEDLELLRKYWQ